VNVYVSGYKTGRQKILHRNIAIISRVKFALNFFRNAILIFYLLGLFPNILIYHIFDGFIVYHYVVQLSCTVFTRHEYTIVSF